MRRAVGILGILAVALPAYGGGDPPPAPPAPRAALAAESPTPEQAADAILAAVLAKDDAAVARLAEATEPDAWLVAQSLLARHRLDAATEFARRRATLLRESQRFALPDPDVGALPAYLESPAAARFDGETHARVAGAEALASRGVHQEALSSLPTARPADPVLAVRSDHVRANALRELGRLPEAMPVYLRAIDDATRLQWSPRARRAAEDALAVPAARDPRWAGEVRLRYGRILVWGCHAEQEAFVVRSLAGDFPWLRHNGRFEELRRALGLGAGGRSIGYDEAISALDEARELFTKAGDRAKAADALELLSDARERDLQESLHMLAHMAAWRRVAHVRLLEQARRLREETQDAAGRARALETLGGAYGSFGSHRTALLRLQRALELRDGPGDRAAALRILDRMLAEGRALDDVSTIRRLEGRVEALASEGSEDVRLGALRSLAQHHAAMGDGALALRTEERLIAAARGREPWTFDSLVRTGRLRLSLGEFAAALADLKRARKVREGGSGPSLVDDLRDDMARAHEGLGEYREAVLLRQSRLDDLMNGGEAFARQAGKESVALAVAIDRVGRTKEAIEWLESLAADRSLEIDSTDEAARIALARIRLAHGEAPRALASAREMLADTRRSASDMGAEGAEELMVRWSGRLLDASIEVGALASLELGLPEDALAFLESSRALTLTAHLSRQAPRLDENAVGHRIPEELVALEAEVRAGEVAAQAALRRALDASSTRPSELRRLRDEVDVAREAVAFVGEGVRRAQASWGGLPPSLTLPELQALLAPDEAFVAYAVGLDAAMAVVVHREAARVIHLPVQGTRPERDVVAEAVAALDVTDPASSPGEAADGLRALLVEPLELPPSVRRVLVSPDGPLTFVPFSLLLEGRDVCCVPSATAYGLLRKDGAVRGTSVLALGDPDYATSADAETVRAWRPRSGGRLDRLPGTAVEAKSVGDVLLLGAQADAASLSEAVARKPRWRSVHLACHGLVDPERPMFSSLALAPTATDDGFLSVVRVLRMRIPSDLVVLSACETGRGVVMKGEGTLGLTRAFLRAGSPRVICSLWKVSDAATQALMTRFYELWNPKGGKVGLSTAQALHEAQEFVRSQEQWKHPYYWAAWVLWGLPD